MERGGASKREREREREREGLRLYVWANNLPVAPFIGEGRVRGKEEGRGRERVRARSPLISIISPALRYSSPIYYRQSPAHFFLANVAEVPPIPRIGATSLYGKRFSAITSSYVCQSS